MHSLVRRYIKTAIAFLALGLAIGVWLIDVQYSPRLAELAYWLVTLGTAGRIAGELTRDYADSRGLRVAIVACGLAQALGILVFFKTMWTRIRPLGSAAREKSGEKF
jgi:hypothetical protein